MGQPKKYYAVARGLQPGIYATWFGPEGAEVQIRGFAGALYRGFPSRSEAERWLANPVYAASSPKGARGTPPVAHVPAPGKIAVYTDGGCRGNPGPGGYGVIIVEGDRRTELAGGFRLTTNNRMELMACIEALKALPAGAGADVTLYSDSRYVVNGISKGWARKWRTNRWMRTKSEAAENSDLWAALLELCEKRRVAFVWVHGHAGHEGNERCDELATSAAQGPDLPEDRAYVEGRTRMPGHPVDGMD
jgi:ribonuclease HI